MSLAKAIGWSVAFLLLVFFVASLFALGTALLVTGSIEGAITWLGARGGAPAMAVQAIAVLVAAALATWVIGRVALGLSLQELRYAGVGPGSKGFLRGLGLGVATAAAALALSVVLGGAAWVEDCGTIADYVAQVGKTVLVLAPAALSEEVVFRGVPLVLLALVLGRGAALVVLAVLFATAHLFNPNVTAIGIGNIAIAGIFLGLAFYAPGGIWTAFGAHLGWNATLAALDAPVSGLPFRIPLLDYRSGTPVWLTGGAFGPEGGLAATLALAAACAVIASRLRKDES